MSLFIKHQIFIACLSMTVLPVSGQVDASVIASLDSMFAQFFKQNEPGGAVLIARNDQIIYEKGFGIADVNTKEAITPKTLFNLGSISKTVVAYGILKLAAEKKLSLNDDLFKYFPDFKDPAISKQVKLYHLLTHTSGLPDSRKIEEERKFYLTAKDEENFAPLKQTDRLEFAPGTRI
jgi:CubicO group peptidase (beta-lactamase class C family)